VKNNSPTGKISMNQLIGAHKGTNGIQITPLRSLRLCGEYNV